MKTAIQKIGHVIASATTAAVLFAGKTMATVDNAVDKYENPALAGAEAARADGMPTNLVGADGAFTKITNTILYAVGIISVIMLILGGIRYVVSGGDSKKVTDAKNTIMYAIIGLIIAILSYAIVNFVISVVGGSTSV